MQGVIDPPGKHASTRMSSPDIGRAALWLASPRADYVTGTDLPVDGAMPGNLLGLIPRPGYGS